MAVGRHTGKKDFFTGLFNSLFCKRVLKVFVLIVCVVFIAMLFKNDAANLKHV